MAARRHISSVHLRQRVRDRAHGRCEYCLSPADFSLDSFTIDHIQPFSTGGDDSEANLAFACHNCNNRKQDDMQAVDPETGEVVALFHPRRDRWSDHFSWSSDYLLLIAHSPTGRATLARLQLNRLGAVNIRRALIALGEEHPPHYTLPQ